MEKYIYENKNWPDFTWQETAINQIFGEVRNLQGKIIGQMNMLGFATKAEATLATLTLDITKSSEIEGEKLDYEQVRSSIARRLGINIAGIVPINRNVEGIVEMMLDATQNFQKPLTNNRLFGWHSALFPTGYSGMHRIEVGRYRSGDMQILSGAMGKEQVHYEAIPSSRITDEMEKFLSWFKGLLYGVVHEPIRSGFRWHTVPDFISKIRGTYMENEVNVSEHKHPEIV